MPRRRNPKSGTREKRAPRPESNAPVTSQLVRDVGTYSFSFPIGLSFDLKSENSIVENVTFPKVNIPGVCVIPFAPTIGVSTQRASVVNQAVQRLFQQITATNSRPTRYTEPDLARYLLAADSLYMMYYNLTRIYGLLLSYSGTNRYMPDALLYAMGVEPMTFKQNMSDFRYFINQLAQKINCFFVPNVLPLFTRHINMCQNVYRDEGIDKAQLYIFVPSYLYKYNELTTPASLTPYLWTPYPVKNDSEVSRMSFANVRMKAEELVQAMTYSEDVGIIGADLLRAYGPEAMIKVPMIDELYTVFPVDNDAVLWAIKNATVYDDVDSDSLVITEDPDVETGGYVVANPKTKAHAPIISKRLIGAGVDRVSDAEMLQMCSWASIPSSCTKVSATWADGGICAFEQVGTEILHSAYIVYRNPSTNEFAFRATPRYIRSATVSAMGSNIDMVTLVDDFRYHPMMQLYTYASNSYAYVDSLWEIANYTLIDEEGLRKIHETSLLAMFGLA